MSAHQSENHNHNHPEFDAIVIGTGFGGAVTACRLVQAGLKICVLERGRRYGPDDFPVFPDVKQFTGEADKNSYAPTPDLSRWVWTVGQGLWDIRDLGQVVAAQAAGYGGGSLIYANVHLRAPEEVFDPHYWPQEYNRTALDPYYDLAAYMLDVNPIPQELQLAKTAQLHRVAKGMDRQAFTPPLAVNFDNDGFNGGKNKFGRRQNQCDMRGQCWQGCGAQAKNTLDLNYLAIVEDARDDEGKPLADIRTMAEVKSFWQLPDFVPQVYRVMYKDHLDGKEYTVTSRYVFLCAGAVNSTELLLKMKKNAEGERQLKYQGEALGTRYHPNADSFAVVFDCKEAQEADYGPTITSALLYDEDHPDRWSIDFKEGKCEPSVGDIITHPDSNSEGILADPPLVYAGSWKSRDAKGRLVLKQVQGEFPKKSALLVSPKDCRIAKVVSTENLRNGRLGIRFECGRKEPSPLDVIVQASGALGTMFFKPNVESGSWEGKDARGTIVLADVKKNLVKDEFLKFPDEPKEMGIVDSPAVELKDWFLVEDGGFPTDLEPLFGLFRSPLWGRRNRFVEPASEPTEDQIMGQDSRTTQLPVRAIEFVESAPEPTEAQFIGQDSRTTQLPVRAIEEFFTAVPRGAVPTTGLLSRTFSQSRGLFSAKVDDDFFYKKEIWPTILPPWLKTAIQNDREQLAEYLALTAEPLVTQMLDNTVGPMLKRINLGELGEGLDIGNINKDDQWMIVRGLLRQSIQLMWGSEVDMGRQLSRVLLDLFPQKLDDLLEWIPRLVCWALDYRVGEGRTAMLLLMGRDIYPGMLSWESKDQKLPRLKASLPEAYLTSVRQTQERVLRKMASTWGGELRTNPASTFMDRGVTVHSQGGCPMGPRPIDPDVYVTEPDGQVIGCPGLYVMDAAAFPTPVGVNPSATIAAIAEYKIETFFRRIKGNPKNWEAVQKKEAKDWADQKKEAKEWADQRRKELDGSALQSNKTANPLKDYQAIGLTFKETMRGYYETIDLKKFPKIDWTDLKTVTKSETFKSFEANEAWGMAAEGSIEINLIVEIKDLSQFLARHEAGHIEQISVTGQIEIMGLSGRRMVTEAVDGYIQLFLPADSENQMRLFRYVLCFSNQDINYVIHGVKVLSDEPGLDVWHDAATLYFDLFKSPNDKTETLHKTETLIGRGILRLPATKFLEEQLPSFEITNTTDPARKSWALVAFGKFFFRNLVEVYIPELDRVVETLKNVGKRTHG